MFDSGYERGAPAQFSLDGVAPGFQMPMPLSGITLFGNAIHSGVRCAIRRHDGGSVFGHNSC